MANTSGAQASIGNGQTMNVDAAMHWNAMVGAILRDHKVPIIATEGTRTRSRQSYLYDGYRFGRIDPTTGRKFNPAWSPDSPYAYHLSGRAVDVGSGVGFSNRAEYRIFREYAKQYGFRETVKGEPWHFEWRSDWVSDHIKNYLAASNPAGSNPTPIPVEDDLTPEQDRMLKYVYEVLSSPGPDNDGVPLVKQIGGAFRDSSTAVSEISATRAALGARDDKRIAEDADTRRALGVRLERIEAIVNELKAGK